MSPSKWRHVTYTITASWPIPMKPRNRWLALVPSIAGRGMPACCSLSSPTISLQIRTEIPIQELDFSQGYPFMPHRLSSSPLVGEGTEIPDDHAVYSRSVRCRVLYWNVSEYEGRA